MDKQHIIMRSGSRLGKVGSDLTFGWIFAIDNKRQQFYLEEFGGERWVIEPELWNSELFSFWMRAGWKVGTYGTPTNGVSEIRRASVWLTERRLA